MENFFSKIGDSDSQLVDRPRKLARGEVEGLDDLGWPAKEIFNTTPAHVVFKDAVRIIQITNDQIETGEIICQLRWQFRIPGEEARERSVFDRAYCLRVKSLFGKYRNVFVTKNLNVCMWTSVAQSLEARHGANKIAGPPAADNQDVPHAHLL